MTAGGDSKPDAAFLRAMSALGDEYVTRSDPIEQSGFTGGPARWREERSPIVQAIDRDGSFLDVGCANGKLAADVRSWALERGHHVDIHGIDLSRRLVEIAQRTVDGTFEVADAWTWEPDRQWTFVYTTLDISPPDLWPAWLRRIAGWIEPHGRMIVGAYGSRSAGIVPPNVADVLTSVEFELLGSADVGHPMTARFAWTQV